MKQHEYLKFKKLVRRDNIASVLLLCLFVPGLFLEGIVSYDYFI